MASGNNGDGERVVVSSSIVPLSVEVSVNGFIALVRLEDSVLNVVLLDFGGLADSVATYCFGFHADWRHWTS